MPAGNRPHAPDPRAHGARPASAGRRSAIRRRSETAARARAPELAEALRGFRRQALHAETLEFAHPATGAPMRCRSRTAGGHCSRCCDALREDARESASCRDVRNGLIVPTGPRRRTCAPWSRRATAAGRFAAAVRCASISARAAATMPRPSREPRGARARRSHLPAAAALAAAGARHRMSCTSPTRDADAEPEADAAVTRTPGCVLAILTADCLPVLLCAHDGSEIAVAHAGWRGLSAGVLENTLAAMRTAREAFSPGSARRSGRVLTKSATKCARLSSHTSCRRRGIRADASGPLALRSLRARTSASARGRRDAIHGGGFDTFTDPRLYSYRRDGASSGRFATLIWCVGDQNRR